MADSSTERGGRAEEGEEYYAMDGSVDLRGNPVLRSKTGGWTACSFVVVYEVFERTAYYGISSNLVLYLTYKLRQGTVEAANNVTNWVGTVFLTPILGAYIADAHLGRYWTFTIGSAIYISGMCLLILAVSISTLKPAACNQNNCDPASTLQVGVFFGALYIVALATGLTKPNVSTIGADQFDEFDPREKKHKLSFFNWWMFTIFIGTLFAQTILVYIQDNVGWTLGYGLSTLGLVISVSIFLLGTRYYRHRIPQGSPLTKMTRVVVAALRKRRVPVPKDSKDLYELDSVDYASKRKFRIESTDSIRFLDKAAVRSGSSSAWSLCTVTEVEETKRMLRLVPILFTMFIPCTVIAQASTLFVKQGTALHRHIGPRFQIPPASLGAFITVSMLVSVVLYDRYFVKIMRRWTKNPRGITLLQRIGIGLLLHVIVMLIAFATERRRLSVARAHGQDKTGGVVPLSILTLLPQFIFMGISDAFAVVGRIEFFYDQAPESMKSLGASYDLTAYSAGNFVSSLLLKLVSHVTSARGQGWILNNLSASHLDYYYALLAILSAINLGVFLWLARAYSYKAELCESVDVLKEEQGRSILQMSQKFEPCL